MNCSSLCVYFLDFSFCSESFGNLVGICKVVMSVEFIEKTNFILKKIYLIHVLASLPKFTVSLPKFVASLPNSVIKKVHTSHIAKTKKWCKTWLHHYRNFLHHYRNFRTELIWNPHKQVPPFGRKNKNKGKSWKEKKSDICCCFWSLGEIVLFVLWRDLFFIEVNIFAGTFRQKNCSLMPQVSNFFTKSFDCDFFQAHRGICEINFSCETTSLWKGKIM